jgi:hypothetical protein
MARQWFAETTQPLATKRQYGLPKGRIFFHPLKKIFHEKCDALITSI